MSRPVNDELGWRLGERHSELYAHCLWLWAGLGDLVHDSKDPMTQPGYESAQPVAVDRFVVFNDFDIETQPITRAKIGQTSLQVTFGSWEHVTRDGEHREFRERRFILDKTEVYEASRNKYISRKELLVGQGCVALTESNREEIRANGEEPSVIDMISQTYNPDAMLVESVTAILRSVPNSKLERRAVEQKRSAREAFYDKARTLHDIDPRNCSFDFLGNPVVEGRLLKAVTRDIRVAADRVNGQRLQLWYARGRLFDYYRRRQSILQSFADELAEHHAREQAVVH